VDIVHIHELRSTVSVLAYSSARRLGIPFVLSAHGGLRHIGKARLKAAYDTLWGRRILRDATAVLAISPLEESDASSMLVEGSRVRRLPNAVDLSAYAVMPQPAGFQRKWQLSGRKIVLFLGRLHWVKGADLLLEAFGRIAASYPSAQLVLAGPDDGQEAALRSQAARLQVSGRVTFTGYLDHHDKLEAFVDASVVAIPSRSEVFAITAVEALMCARPVLMSSACGLFPCPQPEHGVTIFESESADDLAGKLAVILSGAEAGPRGALGKAFAAREFSAERIGKQAEDIYSDVLQFSKRVS
jgi:glycosyltransferase involved in cell wall biosynthesis